MVFKRCTVQADMAVGFQHFMLCVKTYLSLVVLVLTRHILCRQWDPYSNAALSTLPLHQEFSNVVGELPDNNCMHLKPTLLRPALLTFVAVTAILLQ